MPETRLVHDSGGSDVFGCVDDIVVKALEAHHLGGAPPAVVRTWDAGEILSFGVEVGAGKRANRQLAVMYSH